MRWSCSEARRRLPEYHDGELTVEQQVAIEQHLQACPACAAEARGLGTIAAALRTAAADQAKQVDEHEMDGLAWGVVSRMKAEREESLSGTLHRMFEDFHLVWAALGATAATFACLAITVGLVYFSSPERLDSLAAAIDSLSNPGSNANPIRMDPSILVPRQEVTRAMAFPEVGADEVWAVNATITREGRVADLQLLMAEGTFSTGDKAPNWNVVGQVLDSAAMMRFEPARSGGSPVAVTDMVWVFARMTVRAKAPGAVQVLRPGSSIA